MKQNVDLTENRIFSRDNWAGDIAMGVLTLSILTKEKFPWNAHLDQIRSDDEFDLVHQKRSIIAVGDKKTRAKIKEYRHMDSIDYCDCCGARMNLIPWNFECGICQKCEREVIHEDRCMWRKHTKEVIRNAVIRTA